MIYWQLGEQLIVSEILNNYDKKVVGLLVVAELSKLNGKSRFNFPVESFISF